MTGTGAGYRKRLLSAWVLLSGTRQTATYKLSAFHGIEKARHNSNIKLPFAGLVSIVTIGYAGSVRFTEG